MSCGHCATSCGTFPIARRESVRPSRIAESGTVSRDAGRARHSCAGIACSGTVAKCGHGATGYPDSSVYDARRATRDSGNHILGDVAGCGQSATVRVAGCGHRATLVQPESWVAGAARQPGGQYEERRRMRARRDNGAGRATRRGRVATPLRVKGYGRCGRSRQASRYAGTARRLASRTVAPSSSFGPTYRSRSARKPGFATHPLLGRKAPSRTPPGAPEGGCHARSIRRRSQIMN